MGPQEQREREGWQHAQLAWCTKQATQLQTRYKVRTITEGVSFDLYTHSVACVCVCICARVREYLSRHTQDGWR